MLGPTDAELRAVFGPRAEYYLAQWHGTARRSYNWSAFFFGGLWFPFRRMYGVTAAFWAAAMLVSVCSEIVFRWSGYATAPRWAHRTTAVLAAFACGVAGNFLYLSHARRLIAATRARGLTDGEHLAALSTGGGTRLSHALACLALLVLLIVAGAAIEMAMVQEAL